MNTDNVPIVPRRLKYPATLDGLIDRLGQLRQRLGKGNTPVEISGQGPVTHLAHVSYTIEDLDENLVGTEHLLILSSGQPTINLSQTKP